jgi:hypothetical protein
MMAFNMPSDEHDCMEDTAPYVEGLEACTYTENDQGCWVNAVRNGEHLTADCDTMMEEFGLS